MAYPTGMTSVNVTGTFKNLVYNKSNGNFSEVPRKGFVQITPGATNVRLTTTGVVYDLKDLVNTYYALDSNGTFTASLIITNQPNIEPNNGWKYSIRFSFSDKVVEIAPVSGSTINISSLYVPDA
jgi:hypothetical protein